MQYVGSLTAPIFEGEVRKSRLLRRRQVDFDDLRRDGSGGIDLRVFSRLMGIDVKSSGEWGQKLMVGGGNSSGLPLVHFSAQADLSCHKKIPVCASKNAYLAQKSGRV
jgi:hypothetical protein